ncbi:MAG: response regulator [Desulfonatronovibrio sp.]
MADTHSGKINQNQENIKEKVLIIDDEPSTLRLFCMFLEFYGFEPLQAENGQNGLEIFKKNNPRIVFTDIKMPGMDGIEVLKRIKSMEPLAEVIVITGHGDMDLALQALNFDATDFINKPIKREDLENALIRAGQRIDLGKSRKKAIDVLFPEQDSAEIKLYGNINAFSEPFIQEAFQKCLTRSCSKLTLIFKASSSINGAGITALGDLLTQAAQNNIRVIITGLSSNFLKAFEELGLLDMAEVKS